MENDYKINFENNSLDEEFVKKGINEDLKNEIFNKISDSNFKFDPNIHFVEDPEFIFKLDYNKSHPFDNQCKFPVIRHDDVELTPFISNYRETDCSIFQDNQSPIVHQHRNGEILIAKPNRGMIFEFTCFYIEISGTLRPNSAIIKEIGNWTELPIGKRILIQKDQFLIKCLRGQEQVYFNVFAWISDKPRLFPDILTNQDKYSISMLIIDSTSRNQFFRQMPLTLKWIKEKGFQVLNGYTKIGDNSAPNLIAILTGMVFSKSNRGFDDLIDDDAVLNLTQIQSDFSQITNSLIAKAKKAGCVTLWNDEIANPNYGLFHYYDFRGFDHPIADYYYRPYYQYVYKKLRGVSGCRNGIPILPKWLELWEQFTTKFSNKCHFAFNFYTGLTHASSNNVQLFDIPVSDALVRMEASGVLKNTFLIIMGDHGQRISPIQKTNIGRIEERMPLFSIHVPENFKNKYPEKYANLIKNQNRLTSNFDIHETLEEILALTISQNDKQFSKHGISLFQEIPKNRTCKDAMIPENFCTCMEELDPVPTDGFDESLNALIGNYFFKMVNQPCIANYTFTIDKNSTWLAISKMVRSGIRYPIQWVNKKNKDKILREVFEIEFNIDLYLQIKGNITIKNAKLLARIQYNTKTNQMQLNIPPWFQTNFCENIFVLDDICGCFKF